MKREASLLASAKEFLVEALDNYKGRKHSFAIVHAVTATELVLKARLARINPTLVYRNIDAPSFRGEQTVALSKLPQRLANLGVLLDVRDAGLIRTFSDWRNQIVHHMPAFDTKAAEQQLPRLLDFLASFLRRELGTPLETFLPKPLYRAASTLLREWERVVAAARAKAESEGSVLSDRCPLCGITGVLCLRDEGRVHCHLCESKQYRHDHCDECGRETVSTFSTLDEGNYCDECIDEAGDRYLSMLSDIERGK